MINKYVILTIGESMKNKKRKVKSKLIPNLIEVLVVLFILLVIGFITAYFYNETYKFNIIENDIQLKLRENYNINVIAKNPKNYPNIRIVDNWSNFLRVTDEANRKFEWLQKFTTPSEDPLHWDEPTTKLYMQLAFDTANM